MTTKATRDVIDLAIRPVQDIDINGGTIDNTIIGSEQPAYGSFDPLIGNNTTLNGTTIVNDILDLTNATVIGNLNAYYADVAENYEADKSYEAGTIVALGGDKEITQITDANKKSVFGVISTAPAMIMNSSKLGEMLPVAMLGRVPVKIVGAIKKGQYIVPFDNGVGIGVEKKTEYAIGRSLETVEDAGNDQLHLVEAAVTVVR